MKVAPLERWRDVGCKYGHFEFFDIHIWTQSGAQVGVHFGRYKAQVAKSARVTPPRNFCAVCPLSLIPSPLESYSRLGPDPA